MGMSEHALFEFHVSSWISDDNSGPATLPEVEPHHAARRCCASTAQDESDSLCPKLDPKKFNVVKVKGGHHFDGDYAGLARQILAAAQAMNSRSAAPAAGPGEHIARCTPEAAGHTSAASSATAVWGHFKPRPPCRPPPGHSPDSARASAPPRLRLHPLRCA